MNTLYSSTSLYLKQHAHQPVHWIPWEREVFLRAKTLQKLVIISIGYSSCHWCHVMAHECFEDSEVAKTMNAFFINVKVDREELPEVDHFYMKAISAMGGNGGWPLNCICLPDGRPIYAATYLPKNNWIALLNSIQSLFVNEQNTAIQYANQLESAIKESNRFILDSTKNSLSSETIHRAVQNLEHQLDYTHGLLQGAPKFIMPGFWLFLLEFSVRHPFPHITKALPHTLKSIAMLGIRDLLNGGFYRYSTDSSLKIPHFEKMLYDQAQLINLFWDAYAKYKDGLYLNTAQHTLQFMESCFELPQQGFAAALDADTADGEGVYYCWNLNQLKNSLSIEQWKVFTTCFDTSNASFWEEAKAHVLRYNRAVESQLLYNCNAETPEPLQSLFNSLKKIQSGRAAPVLDTKQILSWNALVLKTYVKGYETTGKTYYKNKAASLAHFLMSQFYNLQLGIWQHQISNFKAYGKANFEDLSYLLSSLLDWMNCSEDASIKTRCRDLTQYIWFHFKDPQSPMFFFGSESNELPFPTIELQDGVQPSANALMAENLLRMGLIDQYQPWIDHAKGMILSMQNSISNALPYYSQWAKSAHYWTEPMVFIKIVGNSVDEIWQYLHGRYRYNCVLWVLIDETKNAFNISVCDLESCKRSDSDIPSVINSLVAQGFLGST